MSKVKKQSQPNLWLITCSDLFFLLFAFFVLNHSLPTPEKIEEVPEKEEQQQIRKDIYYKATTLESALNSTLSYNLSNSWFSEEGELSMYGDSSLSSIVSALKFENSSVKVQIDVPKIIEQSNILENTYKIKRQIEEKSKKKVAITLRSDPIIQELKTNILVKF